MSSAGGAAFRIGGGSSDRIGDLYADQMQRRTASVLIVLGMLAVAGCTSAPATVASHAPSKTHPAAGDVQTDDPWAHNFDAEAKGRTDSPYGPSWGSFGLEGSVSPVGNGYGSVPAGQHSVVVECVGPAQLVVTMMTTGATAGASTQNIVCPGTANLSYTTTGEGLDITMDSHGEQGAWLVDVTS